jgi:hypothetical protein
MAGSQSTTTVMLENGCTRRVVTFALWRIIATDVVGERELSDAFYDRAWREINPVYMLEPGAGGAEFRMMRVAAVGAAARVVATAADGTCVLLPVSTSELAGALGDCVRAIDQNTDLFLGLSPDEREDVMRCRRVATTLLRALDSEDQPARADRPPAEALSVPEFSGSLTASRRAEAPRRPRLAS